MNILQRGREAARELAQLLRQAGQARMAFEARRHAAPITPPRATRLFISGNMVQVQDADTHRTLAFRERYADAMDVAQALERGTLQVQA